MGGKRKGVSGRPAEVVKGRGSQVYGALFRQERATRTQNETTNSKSGWGGQCVVDKKVKDTENPYVKLVGAGRGPCNRRTIGKGNWKQGGQGRNERVAGEKGGERPKIGAKCGGRKLSGKKKTPVPENGESKRITNHWGGRGASCPSLKKRGSHSGGGENKRRKGGVDGDMLEEKKSFNAGPHH